MLQTVSSSSAQVTASGASTELSDAWRSKVLPLCVAAFNRYPFIAGSSEDVPLGDFIHLLGPDGLMQKFFDKYLAPLVDTTATPWKWQSPDHTKLGLSPGALAEFERADAIRQALFSDGAKMGVTFQLVPVSASAGVGQVRVQIGSQTLSYAHGPIQPASMQWPGKGDNLLVRVVMTPANGGAATVIENEGPWSLLRLLDAARVIPSGAPDQFPDRVHQPRGRRHLPTERQQRAQSVQYGRVPGVPLPAEFVTRPPVPVREDRRVPASNDPRWIYVRDEHDDEDHGRDRAGSGFHARPEFAVRHRGAWPSVPL